VIESFRYLEHAFVVSAQGDAIELGSGSDFQQGIRDPIANGDEPRIIRERASAVLEGLLADSNLLAQTPSYGQLGTELRALKDPNASILTDLVTTIVNQTPETLVQSSEFAPEKGVVNDALIAIRMTTDFDRADALGITTMRQMAFLENFVEGISPLTAAEIRKRLDRPSDPPPDPERVRLETLVASTLHACNSMSWAALYGVTGRVAPPPGAAPARNRCALKHERLDALDPATASASIASGFRFDKYGHDPLRLDRLRPSAMTHR
jgi:hypothetical protein